MTEEEQTLSLPAYAQGGCVGQSATILAEHAPRTEETGLRDRDMGATVGRGGEGARVRGVTGGSIEREFEPQDRGLHKQDATAPDGDEESGINALYRTLM